MANICSVAMKVVLPANEKEDFLGLFWDYKKELDEEKNDNKRDNFASCSLVDFNVLVEKKDKGLVEMMIYFDCRWSVYTCLVSGYPNPEERSLTLKEALQKYKVKYLYLLSEECGVGFNERFEFNANEQNLDELDMEVALEERDYWCEPENTYVDLNEFN